MNARLESNILYEDAIPISLPYSDTDYLLVYLVELVDEETSERTYYVVTCSEDICIWFPFKRGFKDIGKARKFLDRLIRDLVNGNLENRYVRFISLLLVDKLLN